MRKLLAATALAATTAGPVWAQGNYDGKTITYGSDAELANAISDLETRIATASTGIGSGRNAPGVITCTMPAPPRWAADAARWAAPPMPGDPATTRHAARHL